MKNLRISIIIPTYNDGDSIAQTIKTVLSQTYTNWELIIVDDGSTDNTAQIVKGIRDKRVKYSYKNTAWI